MPAGFDLYISGDQILSKSFLDVCIIPASLRKQRNRLTRTACMGQALFGAAGFIGAAVGAVPPNSWWEQGREPCSSRK